MNVRLWVTPVLCASALLGQAPPTAPVVNPRGATNPFTQQPSPATIASGGIVSISGLNFGPAEGAKADGFPLPTRLGGIRVLLNGTPMPLLSVDPGQILAQVPWEINPGANPAVVQAVVESGNLRSLPVRFFVRGSEPALRSVGDKGFGPVSAQRDATTMRFSATGLGAVDPAVKTGEAGPADPMAEPKADVRAFIGGIPAKVKAVLASDRVGEFDVTLEIPEGAARGDVVQLSSGARAANRLTMGSIANPDVSYLALAEGMELHTITGSDLRGAYVLGSGPRDADGCYSSVEFDFAKKAVTPVDGCLTAANRNAPSPFIPVQEGAALVAFEGPPEGSAPEPVSSKVRVFNPGLEKPLTVQLPESAANLSGLDADTAVAIIPGSPAVGIDLNTGETKAVTGVGAGGGGQANPGGGQGQVIAVDLGDGLDHVLSPRTGTVQNRSVVVVGDDPDMPTRAKIAVLDQTAKVVDTRDFPDGLLPLIGPAAAPRPGVQQPAVRFRSTLNYDSNTRVLYVLSRKPDDSAQGFAAFSFAANGSEKALLFPDGWFAATCTPATQLFSLELSRRLALVVTNKPETEIRTPCQGLGFGLIDLASQKVDAVPISGSGFVTVDSVTDMNDFLIGTNVGNARQPADTLHVLDGVTGSAYRIQPPAGVNNFGALRPVPQMGLLVAPAQDRNPGDQGIVVFDLERVEARLLTLPDRFMSMSIVDIMPATRAIVARGIRNGNTGAQYLLFDLITTELTAVRNPEGVAWVGGVPLQPTPGQPQPQGAATAVYQDANPKANTFSAVCFDSDRKQIGVMMVRVP